MSFIESFDTIARGEYPAQGLVKIETTRTNDFAMMGVIFGWVDWATEGVVGVTQCIDKQGTEGDYPLNINPEHIVTWRYADLVEVA